MACNMNSLLQAEEDFTGKRDHSYCSVPMCSSKGTDIPRPSFHRFPQGLSRKKWQMALRIGKPITDRMVVCSKHFVKQNYFFPDVPSYKKHLKKNAVPSQNLPPPYFRPEDETEAENECYGHYVKVEEDISMTLECCVPGCTSNYKPKQWSHVLTFQFPKEEMLRKQWLEAIGRPDLVPDEKTVVCVKHFTKEHVIEYVNVLNDKGYTLTVPLKFAKLVPFAVPNIFPPGESPFVKLSIPTVRHYGEEIKKSADRKLPPKKKPIPDYAGEDDVIENFETFKDVIMHHQIDFNFLSFSTSKFVLFYKIDRFDYTNISVALKVFDDMSLQMWCDNESIPICQFFKWALGETVRLSKWSQFKNLLVYMNSFA